MKRSICDPVHVVVTNCTTRKRAVAEPLVLSEPKRRESLATLASRWHALLRKAPRPATAGELYVGRSIVEARHVARHLEADLYVVSAGLGLIHESQPVPNYDLSVNGQDGPLKRALEASDVSATEWWSLLTARSESGKTLASLLQPRHKNLLLVALPASYLRLVANDFAAVSEAAVQRIRIFTSTAGQSEVPRRLRPCVLPYDERLESIARYDGTRADFPQRALRHFVVELRGHTLSLKGARLRVAESLEGLRARTVPRRQKKSDAEIIELIKANWARFPGRTNQLLPYLRKQANVACEQARFAKLRRRVESEAQAGVGVMYGA